MAPGPFGRDATRCGPVTSTADAPQFFLATILRIFDARADLPSPGLRSRRSSAVSATAGERKALREPYGCGGPVPLRAAVQRADVAAAIGSVAGARAAVGEGAALLRHELP